MDPLVKIMGVVDLVAAFVLLTQHFSNILLLIVGIALLVKGVISLLS